MPPGIASKRRFRAFRVPAGLHFRPPGHTLRCRAASGLGYCEMGAWAQIHAGKRSATPKAGPSRAGLDDQQEAIS
jgi:hypothetical protein